MLWELVCFQLRNYGGNLSQPLLLLFPPPPRSHLTLLSKPHSPRLCSFAASRSSFHPSCSLVLSPLSAPAGCPVASCDAPTSCPPIPPSPDLQCLHLPLVHPGWVTSPLSLSVGPLVRQRLCRSSAGTAAAASRLKDPQPLVHWCLCLSSDMADCCHCLSSHRQLLLFHRLSSLHRANALPLAAQTPGLCNEAGIKIWH